MTSSETTRRRFVAEQRLISQNHFDQTAWEYDERYGRLERIRSECVARVLAAIEPGQEVLDAACGTGKYFGVLAAGGHRIFGIDQSAEMLALAHAKWPEVPTRRLGLQYLNGDESLRWRFGGLVCIDVMEWVLRDDWPVVLDGFRAVLRPGSPAYLNVELPGEHETVALEKSALHGSLEGATPREIVVHDWVNHFPDRESVLSWLSDAGFAVTGERVGDGYWHLLLRSP